MKKKYGHCDRCLRLVPTKQLKPQDMSLAYDFPGNHWACKKCRHLIAEILELYGP